LNVRIGSDTHRILAIEAQARDLPINAYIKEILVRHIKNSPNAKAQKRGRALLP